MCRNQTEKRIEDISMNKLIALTSVLAISGFAAADLTVDLAGMNSWDGYGSANNEGGAGNGEVLVGITWSNVVGDGLGGASWGNEMSLAMAGSGSAVGVSFFPAEGSGSAGGVWGPSDGTIDLSTYGVDQFDSWQLYEGYDDGADAIDASYISGTVTFHTVPIPAPGAFALLGLAGIASRRRRK